MATCPECRYHFRTMEDEPADECPRCGYTGRCEQCGEQDRDCRCDDPDAAELTREDICPMCQQRSEDCYCYYGEDE